MKNKSHHRDAESAEDSQRKIDESLCQPDEYEWLKTAANNPAFAFLHNIEEDIYTIEDGKPFIDEP